MIKIVIDPGHGEKANPSPVLDGFYEGRNNFDMAERLVKALSAYKDIECTLTKSNVGENPTLEARGKNASFGADLFYSIHSNAFSDPEAYGVSGFVSVNTPDAAPLAEEICKEIAALLGKSRVRRVEKKTLDDGRDYYGVLRASKGAKNAFLIEHGFHTNPDEAKKLADPEWKDLWAEKTAAIIARFFSLTRTEAPPEAENGSVADELREIALRLNEIADSL